MSENLKNDVLELGRYSLVPGAVAGWESGELKRSSFFQSFFIVALALATASAILWYFIHVGKLEFRFSSFNRIVVILYMYAAMKLNGDMNRRRAIELILFGASSLIFEFVFFGRNVLIAALLFPISSWMLFYWMVRYPNIIGKLGLRKKQFFLDATRGLAFAAFFMGFFLFGASAVFSRTFQIDYWSIAARASSDLSFEMCFFMYLFSFCRGLKHRGIDLLKRTGMMFALCVVQQAPVFISFFITGEITAGEALLGSLGNSLLIVMSATIFFNSLKNILPVAMSQTSLVLAGQIMGIL